MNASSDTAAVRKATHRRWLVLLYVLCTTASSFWSVHRYRHFDSGWAWDLAHVNQSFWAVAHGVPQITVRPLNQYAQEGPEPWRSVHLALLRVLLLPAYTVWPCVETLLIGHSVIFWLSLFSVARLARGGDRSAAAERFALIVALVWAVSPAAFLMAINDCRPLQMGVPFLLWAIAGYREGRWRLFVPAAVAAMACRQEYGIAIACLAFLPQSFPDETGKRRKWFWMAIAVAVGTAWFLAYLGYLYVLFGPHAPERYFWVPESFARPDWQSTVLGWLGTLTSLAVLTGGWSILAMGQPRYLLASLPFLYMIVERNLAHLLPRTAEWHLIRYAAIPIAFWVAGGVISLRRIALPQVSEASPPRGHVIEWLWQTTRVRAAVAAAILVGWLAPTAWVQTLLHRVPNGMAQEDQEPLRQWIARVPPAAVVWADHRVTAMLSSREYVYSLHQQLRHGDPLPPPDREQWAIGGIAEDPAVNAALRMAGANEVFRGKRIVVLRGPSLEQLQP